jgi:hypothetical protein
MLARIVDLFGPAVAADPTKLYGNLMVSPSGNILLGQTSDDGVHKLQVNGNGIFTGAVRVSGTPGIVFTDGSYQAMGAMGKNRIINGTCNSALLGTSVAAATTYTYGGVDRFVCSASVGGFTQSQSTLTYNGITRNAVKQTVTTAVSSFAAAGVWSGIQQIMEGLAVYDMIGQQISVQFLFLSSITGTFACSLADSGATHSCTQTFAATAGVVEWVTLTFPAYSGLVVPLSVAQGLYLEIAAIGGANFDAPALGTWNTGNYLSASGCTNWAATVGNYIMVTDIQVEVGPVCTPVERRLPGFEAMLLSRYVEQITGQYAIGALNSSTLAYLQWKCQPKRTSAVTFQPSAPSTFYIYSPSVGNINPSALTWSQGGLTNGLVTATVSGLTAGQPCILENDSGSYVNILAEY